MEPEDFIAKIRAQARAALDPELATATEELSALDWQLEELARVIGDIRQAYPSASSTADRAMRHLNRAVQRSYRAQQIVQGLPVPRVR